MVPQGFRSGAQGGGEEEAVASCGRWLVEGVNAAREAPLHLFDKRGKPPGPLGLPVGRRHPGPLKRARKRAVYIEIEAVYIQ